MKKTLLEKLDDLLVFSRIHEFILKNIIKEKANKAYYILYSPIFFGILLFPVFILFYPFLFLLFQLLWLKSVTIELEKRINPIHEFNFKKKKVQFNISILTLSLLTLQTPLIFIIQLLNKSISGNLIDILFKYIFPIFGLLTIVLLILMVYSYYIFNIGSKFIGKVLRELELQYDDIEVGKPKIHLNSRGFSAIFLYGYSKTHNRIQKVMAIPFKE